VSDFDVTGTLGDDRIAAMLHTYADTNGSAHLQYFILRDRT